MTEHVLITGGLGYVGGRVAKYLAEHSPYHLTLGTRGAATLPPPWLRHGRLLTLDVTNDAQVAAACEGVTAIVHLSAVNEIESARNPELALCTNSLGSLKVLHAAIRAGVKRFIYFSTAHVYGSPLAGVITEESLPRPLHPYAITHRVAEDFVLAANDSNDLTGIVLRLSNGLGAPVRPEVQRWTLLVNDLCRQAVTTGRLVLRSSGLQRRDFIALSDVVRAVTHFIALPAERCGNGLFNLGGEAALRVIDVVEMIAKRCEAVLGRRPVIERPAPASDEVAPTLEYRIAKLKDTGFHLEGDFAKEIDATLELCQRAFGTV